MDNIYSTPSGWWAGSYGPFHTFDAAYAHLHGESEAKREPFTTGALVLTDKQMQAATEWADQFPWEWMK